MEPEQGALIACIYCTRVHPGLAAGCPRCHGAGAYLRPARMLDRAAAREHVLAALARLEEARRELREADEGHRAALAERCRTSALGLLEDVVIYGFDLADALAGEIRRLEDEGRRASPPDREE